MGRVWHDHEDEERWLSQTREVMNTEQARRDLVAMGRVIMGVDIVMVTAIIILIGL